MCASISPGIMVLPEASILMTSLESTSLSASLPVALMLQLSISMDSFLGFLPVPSMLTPFCIRVFSSIFKTSVALY